MSSDIKIIFEKDGGVLPEEFDFGVLAGEEETIWHDFTLKHSSNYPIKDCSFFIERVGAFYSGTNTATFDYNTLIWMADNYPGYGLSINQKYEVYGTVQRQDSLRLIDTERVEAIDIFTEEDIEILSGPSSGETRTITGYDPENGLFFLNNNFSTDVVGQTYKISIDKTDFFKTKSGSSVDYPIRLLYNAGIIPRFESVIFSLKLKLPPYFKKSAVSNIQLGLKFTPEE